MIDISKINVNTLPARADEEAKARRARMDGARETGRRERVELGARVRSARKPDSSRYAPGTGQRIEALEDLLKSVFEDRSFKLVA